MDTTAVRKYVKVGIKKRKNRTSTSYTLRWKEDGEEHFMSLGPHANASYAKRMRAEKEKELNSFDRVSSLAPVRWTDFQKKYFDTKYPGHELPRPQRLESMKAWGKSWASYRSERLAMDNFARLIEPGLLHQLTTEDRDNFVTKRLAEVSAAASVDTDLRNLRAVFNVAEEWRHVPEGRNPFAGRGKSTVGAKRKRAKEREGGERKEKHYSFDEVRATLALATKEAAEASESKGRWQKRRLRALVYFMAYTGCRFSEAVHLEWKDIDWESGVAFLYFKVEHDLKTEGSQAPFGLPDRLMEVLRDWQKDATCSWVFPNEKKKPWRTGGAKYRPFDQMQALGERAGVKGANFKRFRSALATHGKQRFGMTSEQVRAQLRHTSLETQKHYEKDDLANLHDAIQKVDFER